MPTLRKYLLAGLAVTIPSLVTLYILNIVFQFLRRTIGTQVESLLAEGMPGLQRGHSVVGVAVGLLLTVALLVVVGMISSTVIGRRIVGLGEALMARVPVVGWIYAPARQVVQLLLAEQQPSFRRVVLLPFPHPGSYALGFITAERAEEASRAAGRDLANVFVPTSPTPMTGYLLVVPRESLLEVDLTVEQGMKLIISGGVLTPGALAARAGAAAEG